MTESALREETNKVTRQILREYNAAQIWTATSLAHCENLIIDLAKDFAAAQLEGFAERVKEKIKEQLDMVKIIPNDPSKSAEAEIMHALMVHMHQKPVDDALAGLGGREE